MGTSEDSNKYNGERSDVLQNNPAIPSKQEQDVREKGKELTKSYATKMREEMKENVDERKAKAEEQKKLEEESSALAQKPDAIEQWINKPRSEVSDMVQNKIRDEVEGSFNKYIAKIQEYIKDPELIKDIKVAVANLLIDYRAKVDTTILGDGTKEFAKSLGRKLEPLLTNMNILRDQYPQFATTQEVLEQFGIFIGLPLFNNGGLVAENFTRMVLFTPASLNTLFSNFRRSIAITAELQANPQPASTREQPAPTPEQPHPTPEHPNPKPQDSDPTKHHEGEEEDDDDEDEGTPEKPSRTEALPSPNTPRSAPYRREPSFLEIPNEPPKDNPDNGKIEWLDKLLGKLEKKTWFKKIFGLFEKILSWFKN